MGFEKEGLSVQRKTLSFRDGSTPKPIIRVTSSVRRIKDILQRAPTGPRYTWDPEKDPAPSESYLQQEIRKSKHTMQSMDDQIRKLQEKVSSQNPKIINFDRYAGQMYA
jgi:hypothetical protein